MPAGGFVMIKLALIYQISSAGRHFLRLSITQNASSRIAPAGVKSKDRTKMKLVKSLFKFITSPHERVIAKIAMIRKTVM